MNKNPKTQSKKAPHSKQIKRLWGRLILLTVAITVFAIIFAVTANAYINISKRILFLMKIYQDSLENKKKDKHEDDKKKEEKFSNKTL